MRNGCRKLRARTGAHLGIFSLAVERTNTHRERNRKEQQFQKCTDSQRVARKKIFAQKAEKVSHKNAGKNQKQQGTHLKPAVIRRRSALMQQQGYDAERNRRNIKAFDFADRYVDWLKVYENML